MNNNNNNSNFNQALWLVLGQVCTFALSFISAAILSRYFDKSEYGTYKQILYVYTTLSTLFTVGLPSVFSYFIPRLNTGQQKALIQSVNRLFVFLGIAFSISLFVLAKPIAGLLNNEELVTGIRLFSPFPLFTLPTLGVEGIYTALRKTKSIALYQVFSKIAMLLCIVLPVVAFGLGYKEAIIGWGVASFLTFLLAMYMKNRPYVKIEKEVIDGMYKMVFDYSLPLVGAFVAGFFISSADQFFISRYYGTETFAEASNGCLSIPVATMIASSVKNVLLPLFSKADATGTMGSAIVSYNNAVKKSTTLVFPILLFSIFFAKEIMVFVYGSQYEASGTYLKMYTLREFVACLPYFSVLMALGRSKIYMNMHIVGAILLWGFDFAFAFMHLPAPIFVLSSSILHIGWSVFAFSYIFKIAKVNLVSKDILLHLAKLCAHCVVVLAPIYWCITNYTTEWKPLWIIISGGILFYLIIVASGKLLRINYIESFNLLLKRK